MRLDLRGGALLQGTPMQVPLRWALLHQPCAAACGIDLI